MLTLRLCNGCGRRVRLSTTIQPPRCPVCRLSNLPSVLETRLCLGCELPIPTHCPDLRCTNCLSAVSSAPNYSPCFDCGNSFPARAGVVRCLTCRSRRSAARPPINFGPIFSTLFNPAANSFQRLPQRKRHRLDTQIPESSNLEITTACDASFVIDRGVRFLRQEHEFRVHASEAFPSPISQSHIRLSVARFEKTLELASRDLVCAACGKLVPSTDVRRILHSDPILYPLERLLDDCGWCEGYWNLCSLCHAALLRGSPPKFSAKNNVNVTLCQHYPDALKDLTLTEEYLIAKSHPVGVIVKLRPGGHKSPINYHALRGHFIIIPQDPKPLLRILPSPELQFTELIRVFWMGTSSPTDADLRPFLVVRKSKVLAALQYLVQHNPLYGDVTVARSTLHNWPDDFIPSDLQKQIICLAEADHQERVGYSVNLENGNYENDWQAAEDSSDHITEGRLPVTASVTTDVNGERQNPDIRLLNTLCTLVDNPSPSVQQRSAKDTNNATPLYGTQRRTPVIEYGVPGQTSLLNQWQDPHYFTSAFPTLFPMGSGGHMDDRFVPVSLVAFANWALYHHSRRLVFPPWPLGFQLNVLDSPCTGFLCICYMMSSSYGIPRLVIHCLQNDLIGPP